MKEGLVPIDGTPVTHVNVEGLNDQWRTDGGMFRAGMITV